MRIKALAAAALLLTLVACGEEKPSSSSPEALEAVARECSTLSHGSADYAASLHIEEMGVVFVYNEAGDLAECEYGPGTDMISLGLLE